MGKKRSAARRAAAATAPALAPTASPAVALDTHTTPVDTPGTNTANEPAPAPTQQPRDVHAQNACLVHRTPSLTSHITSTSSNDAPASPSHVQPPFATPNEPQKPPAATERDSREVRNVTANPVPRIVPTAPTTTPHGSSTPPDRPIRPSAAENETKAGLGPRTEDERAVSDAHGGDPLLVRIPAPSASRTHAATARDLPAPMTNNRTAPHTSVPACSAPAITAGAAADLATAIACIGPPELYLTSPSLDFELTTTCDNPGRSVPARWATSLDEIDDELLAQIVEHARKLERRKTSLATSHDVQSTDMTPRLAKSIHEIDEVLVEDIREEGRRDARRQARRDARVDEHRREQAWKDGYEQGRWEGYREGLEVARTEVSTHTRVDATVQVDDTGPLHPLSIDTTPRVHVSMQAEPPTAPPSSSDATLSPSPRVHAGGQSNAPSHPSRADSQPPSPTSTSTTAPPIDTGVQSDARSDSFASPADSYVPRDVPIPTASTSTRVVQDASNSRILIPTPDVILLYTTPTNPNTSTSSNDLSLSYNDADMSLTTAHTHLPSFSWADEASSLPINTPAPLISPPTRDFSILRSSSVRPFDSLKRRARRSQTRPARLSRPSRQFIPTSEPIVTRRHPAGLRADRPSVIITSSPSVLHSVKLEASPLDWQGDPRLQELGRVLRGLGWVHVSGS